MSMNLAQVYAANPVTTVGATDLYYTAVGGLTDGGITGANLKSLANGGTNANLTASNGGIVYSSATAFAILAGTATAGQIIRSGASAAPSWSTSTYPATNAVSTLLYASSANVMAALATANSAVLTTTSAGVPVWSATMTNGQLIIGSTGATPAAGTITVSGNMSITVGAGTIALATTGFAGFAYNDVAGTSQAAAVNNGYIISNAGQTTVTLPATIAQGSVIAIQGKGAAGWIMQANAGQTIHLGSSATSVAGTLTSTNQWDAVEIVCVTANTTLAVKSVVGNLTVA